MLLLLYAAIGRLVHWLMSPFLRRFPRAMVRVRTLVVNDRQEVLLVRSWFGHQLWSLPGGGIRQGESPTVAAAREVFEETGVDIAPRELVSVGRFAHASSARQRADSSAPFTIVCQLAKVTAQPVALRRIRRFEVLEAAWFPLGNLPATRSATVDRAISRARQHLV